MNKLKISLAAFSLVAFAGIAIGQSGQGLWPNLPVVGGSSYSCGSVNGVSNCTVSAGPTALTGNEGIPANTNLSQGRSPQNVLVTPAALNANPITFYAAATGAANAISASTVSGGYVFTAASTISNVNLSLPSSPIHGQQFAVNANRTITTLNMYAASGDSIAGNTSPTVLTTSTTVNQGFRFICSKSGTVCTWYRLQ